MIEPAELRALMDSYSGGSEGRTRHMFNRRMIFTEGVDAVFSKAGAYWLSDIVATEVAPICLKLWDDKRTTMTFLRVDVNADSACHLCLEEDDNMPPLWQRDIEWTTFPEGRWTFYLGIDGIIDSPQEVLVMLLPQEY